MNVTIAATSSWLDLTTILIETSLTIGEQTTTRREIYDANLVNDNRFLTGDLPARIEQLRKSAEAVTEKSVRNHFIQLAKPAEPNVTEVVNDVVREAIAETPVVVKKTRAKRQPKTV